MSLLNKKKVTHYIYKKIVYRWTLQYKKNNKKKHKKLTQNCFFKNKKKKNKNKNQPKLMRK